MKKLIVIAVCLLTTSFYTKAQMTLEHDYGNGSNEDYILGNNPLDYSLEVINLSVSGYKYALQSMASNQVRLYNLDHSLWKTINLPPVTNRVPITAYYISENLFKLDNKVDLAIQYSDTTGNNSSDKQVIIDETGAIINTIDSSFILQIFNTAPNTFVAISSYHGSNAYVGPGGQTLSSHTRVYSLPGTLPCNACSSGLGLGKVSSMPTGISEPIPNPSSDQVKITFTLPTGTQTGEIDIYNTNGQRLKTFKVDNTFSYVTMDNSMLPSGIYYYNLIANGSITTTKKMVVIK